MFISFELCKGVILMSLKTIQIKNMLFSMVHYLLAIAIRVVYT